MWWVFSEEMWVFNEEMWVFSDVGFQYVGFHGGDDDLVMSE